MSERDVGRLVFSWAKQEKANARGRYHEEESGSFEQGLVLGRMQAMSDVVEFIYENRDSAASTADTEGSE